MVVGAVISQHEEPMLVMELMEHGSLYNLLQNETIELDGEHILPILRDITSGVRFLHGASPQIIHGDLKANNILVDARLRAKVADFGLTQKMGHGQAGTPYWMSPEVLRGDCANNAQSDVYSFGVILFEVYSRTDPYEGEEPASVLKQIVDPLVNKRPKVPLDCPEAMKKIIKSCWEASPEERPSFKDLDIDMKKLHVSNTEPGYKRSVLFRKTATESLLDEVFPPKIAKVLREGGKVAPESKDMVTIFFSDIVGFTTISATMSPIKVSDMLDRFYQKIDSLAQKHEVFKVDTIGDSWMGVTNLVKDQSDHAARIAKFSADVLVAASETWIDLEDETLGKTVVRIGFHSGSVVASVVGSRSPRYCLFGDSVNTASRMESHSLPDMIQCSDKAAMLVKEQDPSIVLIPRGPTEIKGKGSMATHWVNRAPE